MKKVTIFWSGKSSSGNNYIGVNYFEGDFAVKKFIQLKDDADMTKYAKDEEIEVPAAALA